MGNFLKVLRHEFPDASFWHVRGRFRQFLMNGETCSIRSFDVITNTSVDMVVFTAKGPSAGQMTCVGIMLSRISSLVESEIAKKFINPRIWKLLAFSLPKETNQRLILFQPCVDPEKCLEILESAQIVRRKFIAAIKKLASEITRT